MRSFRFDFEELALTSSPGLTGRSSIPETFAFIRDVTAYWMPRLKRGMTIEKTQARILATRIAPGLCMNGALLRAEGARNAGRSARPQPRVQW